MQTKATDQKFENWLAFEHLCEKHHEGKHKEGRELKKQNLFLNPQKWSCPELAGTHTVLKASHDSWLKMK